MARPTVIRMAAINLTVHPHPEGQYEKLIRFVQRRRLLGKVHSDRYGLFTQVWASPDKRILGVHGVISTFLQFDSKEPWLNLDTYEKATDEDLNKIELPENLRPSLKRCRFVLDVSRHLLIFDTESSKGGMSPNSMLKFLQGLFSHPDVLSRFGRVSLNVVHVENSVDRVLALEGISEIFIRADRPNTGDFDSTPYDDLDEFLNEQGADKMEQRLTSSRGNLIPNNATVALAHVADEYGYVEVRGRDESGNSVKLSTLESAPLVEVVSFNADVVDDTSAQYEAARRISASVRGRRQRIR